MARLPDPEFTDPPEEGDLQVTDFPAIKAILDASEPLVAPDYPPLTPDALKAAWAEYEQARSASKMEQVNEANANRWMAEAEDLESRAARLRLEVVRLEAELDNTIGGPR